jgi:hypothetical protein
MSTNRDFDRIAGAWLAEGPKELNDRVLDAALDEVHLTHQRRRIAVPWRLPPMNTPVRLVAVVAIIAVVGYAGLTFLNLSSDVGARPSPTPSPTLAPTATPGPTPGPTLPPIDTTGWVTYESSLYELSIGHPPGWEEIPASRPWSYEVDTNDWLSPGMEAFFTADDAGVRVSAWGVPLDPGFTDNPTWDDVEAWIEQYCLRTNGAPCPGVHDRAVQLCLEARDCHPGLLVPFESEVMAFYAGCCTDQMVIVAVWWGETEPAVAQFGGSRRLLEAFLSTMDVWPADGDRGR